MTNERATPTQRALINRLILEREVSDEFLINRAVDVRLTKSLASQVINRLLEYPRRSEYSGL